MPNIILMFIVLPILLFYSSEDRLMRYIASKLVINYAACIFLRDVAFLWIGNKRVASM